MNNHVLSSKVTTIICDSIGLFLIYSTRLSTDLLELDFVLFKEKKVLLLLDGTDDFSPSLDGFFLRLSVPRLLLDN